MKLLVHRIDREHWGVPYTRQFSGGRVFFLTFFQIYFWWRAPAKS